MAASFSVSQQGDPGQRELRRFRNDLFDCFTARADALFDVLDAVCSPVPVGGIAHLSLASASRRGHGGLYAAIAEGGIDAEAVRDVLAGVRPGEWVPDFAVDSTTWPRNDAECSAGRGMYHHPSRQMHGYPVVAGWCYQWLVGLSPDADSWTAPLDARRLAVGANPNLVAVQQIEAVLPRLPHTAHNPLFVFDAGYNIVRLTHELAGVNTELLVRVRNDRLFYARVGKDWNWPSRNSGGRPPLHGRRFSCADPSTWPPPDNTHQCHDPQYGDITVTEWRRLHPQHNLYRHGNQIRIVEGTVIALTVQNLPGKRDGDGPARLWLWWSGPAGAVPDLDRIWRAYLRRYDIEMSWPQCSRNHVSTA